MNRLRITPSVIPNLFTSLNMFSGFLSVISAANGNYNYAAWLILVAALFDALDGLVARLTNSSSELGVELDSLADIISFGAAPSFVMYKTYFYQFEAIGIVLSSLPLIAGGFRLARFLRVATWETTRGWHMVRGGSRRSESSRCARTA